MEPTGILLLNNNWTSKFAKDLSSKGFLLIRQISFQGATFGSYFLKNKPDLKSHILITVSILSVLLSAGQVTTRIRTDSLLLFNDSCNAELNLENQSKNINGFLFNKGAGRTEFRKLIVKINDSTYISGYDTIFLGFPRRFGAEDNRATENRNFTGGSNTFILDSTVFGVRGKDGLGPDLPASLQGPGTRMLFFPKKGAFRAGTVNGTQWDTASMGTYSAALGLNSVASGGSSFAAGSGNASGNYSNALGTSTCSAIYSLAAGENAAASGSYCFALGRNAASYGSYSVAIGNNTNACCQGAAAIGNYSIAANVYAVALGDSARAIDGYAVALGQKTLAGGAGTAFAMGSSDSAISGYGFVMGYRNKSKYGYQTIIGKFNDTTDTKNIFSIAYGASHSSRKNVFTVDTSGKTVVGGTGSPTSWLNINGSFAATVTTVTSNITLDNSHFTILVDAGGGNVTITLPVASSCTGRIYTLKLVSSANSMIVQRSGANTIDGVTSVTKNTQWQSLQVQSNGSNWFITGG